MIDENESNLNDEQSYFAERGKEYGQRLDILRKDFRAELTKKNVQLSPNSKKYDKANMRVGVWEWTLWCCQVEFEVHVHLSIHYAEEADFGNWIMPRTSNEEASKPADEFKTEKFTQDLPWKIAYPTLLGGILI